MSRIKSIVLWIIYSLIVLMGVFSPFLYIKIRTMKEVSNGMSILMLILTISIYVISLAIAVIFEMRMEQKRKWEYEYRSTTYNIIILGGSLSLIVPFAILFFA